MSGVTSGMGAGLAYINPGTGSLLLQVVLMGIAGGYLLVRSGWRRVMRSLQPPSGQRQPAPVSRPEQEPVPAGNAEWRGRETRER